MLTRSKTRNIKQSTDIWKKWRSRFITTSKCAALLGLHEHCSRTKFLQEYRNPEEVNDYTQRLFNMGHKTEPIVREWVEQKTGGHIFQFGFIEDPAGKIGCSPDGVLLWSGRTSLVEIKSTENPLPKEPKRHAVCQTLANMYIGGFPQAIIAYCSLADGERTYAAWLLKRTPETDVFWDLLKKEMESAYDLLSEKKEIPARIEGELKRRAEELYSFIVLERMFIH